jgi:hypothetical protein
MNKLFKYIALASISISIHQLNAQSGTVRAGQAGFTQLLINGWGQSSGMGNSNSAGVSGVESFYQNIAGLGKTNGTDLAFSRTSWLGGTGININSFGFAQKISESGVLGLSVMSFAIGQIPITTVEQPDGGLGTYKPSISNINLGYAYTFGKGISAGINFKVVSESTPDVRTGGIALDAGIQYATNLLNSDAKGSKAKYQSDNPAALREGDIHFGVSIKNLGPDLKYQGDGLASKSSIGGNSYTTTTSQRTDKTQLPSLVNIGLAYDFRLDRKEELYWHRLTAAANFTNNSFSSNQTSIGLEYAFKEILMFRTGFDYEKGIFKYDTRRTAYTGVCFGTSVQFALGKKIDNKKYRDNSSLIAIDYSYRATNPFSGTHTFGIRIKLGAKS